LDKLLFFGEEYYHFAVRFKNHFFIQNYMENKFQIFNTFRNNYDHYKIVDCGNYSIGKGEDLLCASVMSDLAVTLYDPKNKIGALARISRESEGDISPEELKPTRIISTLCKKLNIFGDLDPRRLEATLSGEGTREARGKRNSSVVRSRLQGYKILIIGEDLAKYFGRLVFLNCDTGKVEIYRSNSY